MYTYICLYIYVYIYIEIYLDIGEVGATHRQCCPSDRVASVWHRCAPPVRRRPAARVGLTAWTCPRRAFSGQRSKNAEKERQRERERVGGRERVG